MYHTRLPNNNNLNNKKKKITFNIGSVCHKLIQTERIFDVIYWINTNKYIHLY